MTDNPMTRVTLTPEEVVARAKELAQRLRDRELLLDEHKEQRTEQKRELAEIDKQIKRLSDAVRVGSEDRSEQIGLFP
jgi:uncharacterized coiled-coil DUF342 family protein